MIEAREETVRTISWHQRSAVVSRPRGIHILDRYGFDSFFRDRFAPFAEQGLTAGRVTAEVGPLFRVMTEKGERTAEVSGRLRHAAQEKADLPAVGDWVALRADWGAPRASIFAVMPRRTAFSRKARGAAAAPQVVAANVDSAFLITGLDLDFNIRRIERAVMLARESGAEPVIVLSKADLCDDPAARMDAASSVAPGIPVVAVSAKAATGLADLEPWLRPGKTVVLVGSSGTGKSTLVNTLLGEDRQLIRAVREHDHRGKHTTTRRELLMLPSGALLIDTPGIRELGLWGSQEALSEAFSDIDLLALSCAFSDCTHGSEPRCAVRDALVSGGLDQDRFNSYMKLRSELSSSARKGLRQRRR
jgi:ribosome biogenesis GTPase / thiamine phosphate phosphatase